METESSYNPQAIEQEAQSYWDRKQSFKVTEDLSKEKFYCLCMFPYPSGSLHMGHVRNYTIGDVISRYQRMQGKNVLQPIGWDAFGLPAENAAIQHKIHPAKWTHDNIDAMRQQLKRLGNAYDWRREFATCDAHYYRWEQWLFLKLYEKGLVYRKKSVVNWDPVDQTVLANEQVVDGKGWRSKAPVERREISQWFLKITAYADELLDSLDQLDQWPEQVKTMQRHWIGRSHGVNIFFDLPSNGERLKVYTTRQDTLLGSTYLAIAPTHPLALQAAENNPSLATFIEQNQHVKVAEADMAQLEKQGVDTGLQVIHPITGDLMPVWAANFVLMEYGTGAVMCVPAHDQRDWEFAQKYQLPMKQVITGSDIDLTKQAFTEYGQLINSGEFDGLTSEEALTKIAEFLETSRKGKPRVNYRLRDWGVSRQRYWGTPIPIIHCSTCGAVPVPEDQLPVTLPDDVDITGQGSPLTTHPDFTDVACPKCGEDAKRETDTFDTFVESSWYYARFASYNQDNAMLDDRARYWCPVDHYIGGIEHAVMHLLYARFFHKVLRDEGLLNSDEPFIRLLTQGMVLKDGVKMSKSLGNTVDPNTLIDQYGADTVRLFTMFAAPPDQSLEWSDQGVEGCYRFLKRVWAFVEQCQFLVDYNDDQTRFDWAELPDNLKSHRQQIHQILMQADFDYQRSQFNTVVSACMKLLNLLTELNPTNKQAAEQAVIHETVSFLLRLLAPITPHICHHLWKKYGYGKLIVHAAWPKVAKDALKLDVIEFVVQVNGKLRGHVKVAANADQETIVTAATQQESVARFVDGKTLRKTIVLPDKKLINIVV